VVARSTNCLYDIAMSNLEQGAAFYDCQPGENPQIRVTIQDEAGLLMLYLNRHNTLVRTFTVGEGTFDHAYHEPDDRSYTALPASRLPMDMIELCDIPCTVESKLDELAIDCIAMYSTGDLEAALPSDFQ
jgi:hypothetical protein